MTLSTPSQTDFDPELHAFIDGRLDPEAAAEFDARLDADPELQRYLEAMIGDRDAIRGAADALDIAPTNLRTAALERKLAKSLQRRRWQAAITGPVSKQMAAGVVMFAFGWSAHMTLAPTAGVYPSYVAEGLGAHTVFADDAVYPVEFTPEATTAALDWMSEKLKRKINSPALDALGLELVGTRLSGTREGPLAQFIYEDQSGNRLSLVVMPHPEGAPEADLRVAREDTNSVGYWSNAALDFAVIANTSNLQIETVAAEVTRNVGLSR
jgi:anti-sigma factor RsiW